MSKKGRVDPIERLKEYEDHLYNPYYWVNRLPFGFPPKRSKGFWALALIDVFIILPAFLFTLWVYLSEKESELLLLLILLGAFGLFAYLRAAALKPLPLDDDEENRTDAADDTGKKQREKKLPKRRKDYR